MTEYEIGVYIDDVKRYFDYTEFQMNRSEIVEQIIGMGIEYDV